MDNYQFEQIDKEKIDLLIGLIPEVKEKFEIYSKDLGVFMEYEKQAKELYKNTVKLDRIFQKKRWNANQKHMETRKELFELTKKWNIEMKKLCEKYNHIKLSDFFNSARYSWGSKSTKEFNYTLSLVAKTIDLPLLYELNTGYGKVKLTNMYPKLWLELNGKELFAQSEQILPITDFEKFKK